ncbi:MAG: hypothetical protein IJT94_00315 [Oscillibacter sp.]|nr:hypothetical protein [Oscillibacter sp.]
MNSYCAFPIEKVNDLVAAKHQKNNGMSWSNTGSGALDRISALFLNHDAHNWINKNRISFSLPWQSNWPPDFQVSGKWEVHWTGKRKCEKMGLAFLAQGVSVFLWGS